MIHVTCRLTAKNRDQCRNPTFGNRVWATFFTNARKVRTSRRPGISRQQTSSGYIAVCEKTPAIEPAAKRSAMPSSAVPLFIIRFTWTTQLNDYAGTHSTALCPGLPRWAGTRRQNQSGFYWSKRQWVAVASAGPYASQHLTPDRQPCQHPTTLFLQAGCPSCRPTNSIKALRGQRHCGGNTWVSPRLSTVHILTLIRMRQQWCDLWLPVL